MKKINTESHYDYTRSFDALIDKSKLLCETVGSDEFGNYILHISGTSNIGNAYSSWDEYYILTVEEYKDYLDKSRKNKLISWLKYHRLKNEIPVEKQSDRKIISFEKITLRTTGMRFCYEYEIIHKDETAILTRYSVRYNCSGDNLIPESRVKCDPQKVVKLLNECSILSWDGFHGAHPKGVKDGTMFSFEAVVNGSIKIKASGSQNFPKHFRDFTDGLHVMLRTEMTSPINAN